MGVAREGHLFLGFFELLRAQGLPVSVREWLTWLECLSRGLIAADLNRAYSIGRAVLIKHERHLDLYDQCFAHYFGGAEPPAGLSSALDEWLQSPLPLPELDPEAFEQLEKLDLDRLQQMFEERMKEQTERHDGGSKWVGTGGTSPFGHSGRHPTGIRVGGQGRSQSAVKVAAERRFRAYRSDQVLDTRQMGAALRKLRTLGRSGSADELDLEETIARTAKQYGELEVVLRPPRENLLKLVLLMDVGGSMDPYADLIGRLFSAAHGASHFKAFHPLYFHNCVYDEVYQDANLRDGLPLTELKQRLGLDDQTRLLVLGDAYMAPYELLSVGGIITYGGHNLRTGLDHLQELRGMFERCAWLNPMPERFWQHLTISTISEVFPMCELTLDGLDQAIECLNGSKSRVRS